MKKSNTVLAITFASALSVLCTGALAANSEAALQEVEQQWALIDEYCMACHNFEDWAGSLAFDSFSPDSIHENTDVFEAAIRKMRGRLMPPPGNDKPEEAAIDEFIAKMESYLDLLAVDNNANPGHIAIHRLNRKEYANAVEEILAVKIDAKDLLPSDAISDGFDNVANVLQVSPSFLEQYMSAARAVSIIAVGEENPVPEISSFQAPSKATQYRHVEGMPLGTRGGFVTEQYFPSDGDYEFTMEIASQEGSLQRSYPTWWLEDQHTFILTVDGEEVYTTSIGGYEDAEAVDRLQTPAITEIQSRFKDISVPVAAGLHKIGVGFVARTFAESDRIISPLSPGEGFDNIPIVVSSKTLGPFKVTGLPDIPSRRKIFSCYPVSNDEEHACAEEIFNNLARLAFRRPVTDEDLIPLMSFYENGLAQGGFDTGIQKGIMAMLASTKFLYRSEPLPENAEPGEPYPVSDLELASRLSFFLWSSNPDDELLNVAQNGELSNPDVLGTQVHRMLADPRARNLTENFAYQWLKVGEVDAIDPDPRIFPDFDDDLRDAFKKELNLFVESILLGGRPIIELLDAKHSYIDERLARHYGIEDVRGSQFRRIELDDQRRHGLLGKGGLLMLTSYPNRTSAVLRGAYILEILIGTPPSAPPPGVEIDLDTINPGEAITTMRARLENHRAQPTCNQCHGVMDPLGLALENFNAIGQWRDIDRFAQSPIDANGRLASGQPISGPQDLREALLEKPDQFVQTVTEKLMTFALGRTVEHFDMPVVRSIVREAKANDYQFEILVQGIVESSAFQMKSLPVDKHGDAEPNSSAIALVKE